MALGDVIARLAVNLTLETAAFEEGADAAEKRLNQSAKRFEQIGSKMMAVGAKMSLAFTAPLLALGKSVLNLAEDVQGLQNSAKGAGATFEEFQRGAAAAKSIGIEYDKFGDILRDTQEKLGDFAANGGGELADFFKNVAPKVGVTIDMFRDLSGPKALQLYYDSLVKAGVPQQQMIFYMESIADDGSALIPILRDNGKAMKELGANAAVISDADAEALNRYTQAQTKLSQAFDKLKIAIAKTGLVEAVTAIVEKIGGLVDWLAMLPAPVLEAGVAIAAFVAAAGPMIVVLGTIISSGATVFAALGTIGTAMASTGSIAGAATVAFAALRAAVTTFIAALGPWGVAIGLATAAIVLFINAAREGEKADKVYAKGLEASEATMRAAEKAATDLANAHGKVRDALIEAAKAQAAQIRQSREAAKRNLEEARTALIKAQAYQAAQEVGTTGAPGYAAGFIRGEGDKGVAKAKTNIVAATAKLKNYSDALAKIEKAINTPEAAIFTSAPKPVKKPKTPKSTMATDDQQQKELDKLAVEELRAKLDLATSADERAQISRELLAAEKAERIAEIKSNKSFTADQKKAQLAYIERLYGPDWSNGDIVVKPGLLDQKLSRDISDEQLRQANDMLSAQAGTLQAMADIEPNTKERARLEAAALRMQQQLQTNLLEQQIANGDIADADKRRAILAQQQAAERQQQDVRNMSPLQRYGYDLKTSVANINDAMENIQVGAMQSLTDGIAGAIAGTQKLGDVFKSVAQQIIADLVRIQLQKALVGALGNVLGFGGGGASLSSASIAGAGSFDFSAIPGFATGTNSAPRGLALVGERGPELVNFGGGERVYKNADSKAMMAGRPAASNVFDMRGALVTEDLLAQMDGIASGRANMAVVRERQTGIRKQSRRLGSRG